MPTRPFEVETQARDLEFAYSLVRQMPGVSGDRFAAMGYSMGGGVALKLASRNPQVDAIVGLDPVYGHPDWFEMIRQFPSFDITRVSAASLTLLAGEPGARLDSAIIRSLRFSDRYVARVGTTIHGDFNDFWMTMTRFHPMHQDPKAVEGRRAYMVMCRYVEHFLDGVLRGDAPALAWTARPSEENAMPADLVRMLRIPADDIPTRETILARIRRDGPEKAAADLRAVQDRYPDFPLVDQPAINSWGYGLLQAGRPADGVLVFQLNAALYPRSANANDSMADGYLATGDSVRAAAAYERVLALAPDDPTLSASLRDRLQQNARAFLTRR